MLSAEDLRQLLSRCPDGRLKLDLSGRWLTSVPEAVSQLTEVEVLDLSRIPIKTLPQHLCNLQNLKTLKLSWCDLIEIESVIICLTSLEELDLSGNKFATLPQDLSKLKHLKTLRLGDCDFTVVWSAITQLTSLEELDLSGNAAGTVPQDLSKLKHLKSLRLHRCELTEVCPAITQLTSLEELDLSWNEVRTMPQDLSQLKHLKKLRLVDCELTEVWSAITQLTSLEELDLSRNKVKTVPQDLSNLKHLKILKLESCELTEVWPVITQLTSLEELDLSQNKVKTVPQDLSNLKHLKILKLESCELTEVWPVITQLTSLEELDLSQNKVKTVPQDLSNLKHLKILKLESCELTEVWPVITQLTSLEELDLSWNEVETVPQDLSKLKHLKILRLRDCGLTEVWSAIIQLPSLEELDLSWNEVETVPLDLSKLKHLKILKLADCGLTEVWSAITQLTSLKGLVLNNNSLMELPLELTNLRNLKGLSLTGNPLKIPPTEICGRGVEAVFSYLAEIRLARATHCKVILLGCSMAGKTSLARTLINGEPSCVQEEDRTIVMDRIVWDPIAQGKNLRVSLIDFGGNDWYKIVHHLFIDKDSFFLLVVNLAGYVADNFERDVGSWLKLLLSRVSSPHWKLVGTHADQCTQEDISTKFEAIRRGIRCIYEREGRELIEPLEILVISSQSMSGISKLQEKMLGFVCRHGKVIPVAWLKTLSKLRSADHQDKPFLYFGDLGTVNESGEGDGPGNPPSKHRRTTTALSGSARNDLSRPEQSTLVRNMGRGRHSPPEFVVAFFHAIGAILWYQHTPELSKFIFHNPEYLTGLLKAVFTERLETESLRYANFQSHFSCGTFQQAKENLLERGIMSCDLLKCLWKHKQLDEEVFTAMMHLFIHMGFCVAQDRDQSGEVISLRFPWFLNEKVPDDPDLRQILFGAPTMTRLRITFEYEFLSICPPPMFEKFSVRMHRHTGDEMSRRDWKDGFQAKMYGSHLVVEKLHRGLETVIRFTVAGSDVPQLWKVLAKMKTEMQVVMEEWPGLKFDCHILCPHCIHQRVEKPSWFAGKYADTKCDPKQLHMTCRRNEAVTEIPPCLVYNVEDRRRFHERHKEALQQFVDGTKEEDQTGGRLYADDALSGNSLTVDGEFARELTAFASSVGIILARTADGASFYGTGFRVGDNHFLTNWHVAQAVIEFYTRRWESVTVSFNYRTPDRRTEDFVEVYLHPIPDEVVVWRSPEENLDAAVLQLDTRGMHPNYRLPPPLGHLHGDASCSSKLYFIAHDKNTDRSNRVICLKCPVVKLDTLNAPEEVVERHRLSDARRTLLKTTLRHGSSGSPGFDEHGRLVVMYAKGIHDMGDQHNIVVEQAVNIKAIKEFMQQTHPGLAQHLFPEPGVEGMET